MVPKIMLEGGHAWVHERPIAASAARFAGLFFEKCPRKSNLLSSFFFRSVAHLIQ
jgi:hypothetical protein